MTTQKKFLVLADGSPRTLQTVNYLTEFMPVDENTRIVLYHVFAGIPEEYQAVEKDSTCIAAVEEIKSLESEDRRAIGACLDQAKQHLVAAGFPESAIEIKLNERKNGVARDIIEEARNGYTAVVLRRRGMGALKNVILGSVAVKLLQSLTFIPIIMVGQAPPAKKILLAVDASPHSMKAVEFVAKLLGCHDYDFCIFHAIIGLGSVSFDVSETHPQKTASPKLHPCVGVIQSTVMKLFQDIKTALLASGCRAENLSEKIVAGVHNRAGAIIQEAEDGGYGVIVVGRRGLSKVEAFFMGRVGHEVVHEGKKFTVWVV